MSRRARESMSPAGRGKRRPVARMAIVTAAVLAAAAAATTGFGLLDGAEPAQPRSELPPKTARVTLQTLVDTQTEDGDLGHGETTAVRCRLAGTVTALPAAGATVRRGQALYRVDNLPVVLLYGSLPAYRVLASGTVGTDVAQFERNLYALGYRGFTVDQTYSASTASAVKAWQQDLGLDRTGTVELGRVGYAPGAVRVDSLAAAVGDAAQPGADVLEYTGTTRVVTVELDMSDQRLATKDAAVTVTPPGGGAVRGRITDVTTVISTSSSSGSSGDDDGGDDDIETTIEVTVAIEDQQAVAGLDQASMDVAFTAEKRENVLTVPVAALLALAEGGYGVEVVEGDTTRIVAVRTGMFAGGRVEIAAAGLAEGTTVGIPA
jgi:membrane fusion protein, multidrug efflux system